MYRIYAYPQKKYFNLINHASFVFLYAHTNTKLKQQQQKKEAENIRAQNCSQFCMLSIMIATLLPS